MKIHQLATALALTLSAALASAVPHIGAGSRGVTLATGLTLSANPLAPTSFDFDIDGGPFSLLLTLSGRNAHISSFDLFDVSTHHAIGYSLKDTSHSNIWSVTFNSLAGVSSPTTGAYRVNILGTGTANLKATIGPALIPVPEPETSGLALAGLIVAGIVLRQRKHAA